jgi:hypothetical protein
MNVSSDPTIEAFYANRSHRLLRDQSLARDEITLFARRAGERLHERLPRMSSVPHRVKIVDERDRTGKPDARTCLQMQHKRALSSINKRRYFIMKMIGQTKKNQQKIEQQRIRTPWKVDHASYCQELLERANHIEQACLDEPSIQQTRTDPSNSTGMRQTRVTTSSMSTQHVHTEQQPRKCHSSLSTTFQDALSLQEIENKRNVRIIRAARPVTACTKISWINYC